MVKFTSIPKNMDRLLYLKTISKDYFVPYDILFKLEKECNTEEEFFNIINWIREKNGYNWKKGKGDK